MPSSWWASKKEKEENLHIEELPHRGLAMVPAIYPPGADLFQDADDLTRFLLELAGRSLL